MLNLNGVSTNFETDNKRKNALIAKIYEINCYLDS